LLYKGFRPFHLHVIEKYDHAHRNLHNRFSVFSGARGDEWNATESSKIFFQIAEKIPDVPPGCGIREVTSTPIGSSQTFLVGEKCTIFSSWRPTHQIAWRRPIEKFELLLSTHVSIDGEPTGCAKTKNKISHARLRRVPLHQNFSLPLLRRNARPKTSTAA